MSEIFTRVKLPSPRTVPGVEFPVDEVDHEAYIHDGRFFYWSTLWGRMESVLSREGVLRNATLVGQADAPVPSDLGQGDDLNPPAWFVVQANKMREEYKGG